LSAWTLIQIVFDIFFCASIFIIIMRMNRAPKDDPRLSRGLQLLQSKIAVLEDLSDRTETQVGQLTAILEQKSREVQAKVQLAEQHVAEIRHSMDRSLEVAKIFQDKIPHKEIIERQNTIKYVQAARLAHAGKSVEEILTAVDLPRGEIEFIASVNRDRLMFAEDQLPEWAKDSGIPGLPETQSEGSNAANYGDATFGFSPQAFASTGISFVGEETRAKTETETGDNAIRLRAELELAEKQRLVENLSRLQFEMKNLDMQFANEHGARDLSGAFEVPHVETDGLKKLGDEFRKAVEAGNLNDSQPAFVSTEQITQHLEQLSSLIPPVTLAAETMREAGDKFGQFATRIASEAASVIQMPIAHKGGFGGFEIEEEPVSQAPVHQIPRAAAPAPKAEPPQDPALARAIAQQKVQAALNRGARPAAPQENEELKAARELAKASKQAIAQPTHIVSSSGSGMKPTIVRKVQFPRIDETDV
jgi:hypothetical protein